MRTSLPFTFWGPLTDSMWSVGITHRAWWLPSACSLTDGGRYGVSLVTTSRQKPFYLPPPPYFPYLQVRTAKKVAFAGQGTIVGDQALLMSSIEHNSVIRMDLRTLSTRDLPPLPITTRYEAIFYLYFWCTGSIFFRWSAAHQVFSFDCCG